MTPRVYARGVFASAVRLGCMADRPPPDPAKLLEDWMQWERGDETPGRVMANLKTHGLRELLEHLGSEATATSSPTSS
jgi:hypothetical protein